MGKSAGSFLNVSAVAKIRQVLWNSYVLNKPDLNTYCAHETGSCRR